MRQEDDKVLENLFATTFWKRLNNWKERHFVKSSEIESRLGWFSGKVRQYYSLNRVFSVYDLQRLCKEFDIDLNYLLYGEETTKIGDKETIDFLVKYRKCDTTIQELVQKIVNTHLTSW